MNNVYDLRWKILILLLSCALFANAQREDFGLGCEYDMESDGKVPMKAKLLTRDYETMPKAHSLKKYCPIPQSQSGYGTCVGWATTYAARTICEAVANGWTDRKEITREAFSPIFIYKLMKPEGQCKEGSYIAQALEFLKTKGAPKHSSLEVKCCDYIPKSLYSEAENYKIDGYSKLFDQKFDWAISEWQDTASYETKITFVKKAISQDHPVVFSMPIYHSFDMAKECWNGEYDRRRGAGGHAMCVIGYDDNKYGGAFEIMNSWGTIWGNDGFIWIRYDDFFRSCKYAFDVYKKKNIPVPRPVPDPKPIPKKNSFDGEMYILEKDGGAHMMMALQEGIIPYYRASEEYLSGKKFRLYVSNNEPAWVYVISSDKTNNVTKLFPYSDNVSALLDYKQNNIAIPDESHEFQFDTIAGTDYFCVLYSQEELSINQIVKNIQETSGTFYEKVVSALGEKLVPKEDCKYISNSMKVNAKSNSVVVPLVVEIKHK